MVFVRNWLLNEGWAWCLSSGVAVVQLCRIWWMLGAVLMCDACSIKLGSGLYPTMTGSCVVGTSLHFTCSGRVPGCHYTHLCYGTCLHHHPPHISSRSIKVIHQNKRSSPLLLLNDLETPMKPIEGTWSYDLPLVMVSRQVPLRSQWGRNIPGIAISSALLE